MLYALRPATSGHTDDSDNTGPGAPGGNATQSTYQPFAGLDEILKKMKDEKPG